ncbi:metallophosphoesterase family protein [Brevibacillus sp. NPDC058079]|uniref:metallophosphoesterase family protein n=1 Tax=Brevibacillus sp. NPDC058079 TaxID=3346330 RepID=UPI0036E90D90
MRELFVIGDTHGCHTKLKELLQYWNADNQQLIILGDLLDRGEDSLSVILRAMSLQENYGAKIIGGNHEDMFLNWLKEPNRYPWHYFNQGGKETLRSLFDEQDYVAKYPSEEIANMVKEQFQNEVKFLESLPDYHEEGKYVFVHAGVDLTKDDWKQTSQEDFRWIREEFHHADNRTGKIFVFGHTPTPRLNPDKTCNPWFSPCETKIGIDGAAVYGGLLLGLLIKEECYEVYAA